MAVTSLLLGLLSMSAGQIAPTGPAPEYVTPRLRLPAVIGSGMVIQRDQPINLWGTTAGGRKVTVSFRGQAVTSQADLGGNWKVTLAPVAAGGPDELGIYDGDSEILLKDILVGDIWLCSGQSNMAFPVSQTKGSTEAIESASNPRVRLLKVPFAATDSTRGTTNASWMACTPQTVGKFSAVAYYFGLTLQASESVPIGLIDASWGGSTAEAWMPRSSLVSDRQLKPLIDVYEEAKVTNRVALAEYREWLKHPRGKFHRDTSNVGYAKGFAAEAFDDRDWRNMPVPGTWKANARLDINGAVWYRKIVNLPPSFNAADATLELGQIADFDTVYWNNQMVGLTPTSEDDPSSLVRRYELPGRSVRSGVNVIAVRIFNRAGEGGWLSEPRDLRIRSKADRVPVPLGGVWKFNIERSLDPAEVKPREIPFGPGHPAAPSNLYNGMIAPLTPMSIKGVAWYQGEANVNRARQYARLLPRLIQSWRTAFNNRELPFLVVQLPNFRERLDSPSEAEWAEFREAQMAALSLPKTGIAVTIDLGDAKDIHPREKRPFAERLAEAARQIAYFSTTRGLSPLYDGMRKETSKIRLLFSNTTGSMRSSDGRPLRGFAIAGADRRFVWAEARAEGEHVVVWSPEVADPVAVRYLWADNPDGNLSNRAGLPAAPFRTDDWPGLTDGKVFWVPTSSTNR
jgi:sialate O-acetylesterase